MPGWAVNYPVYLHPGTNVLNFLLLLLAAREGGGARCGFASTAWHIVAYNSAYMAVASILIVPIANLFAEDPEVVDYAVQCLHFFAYGYVAWGGGMAIIQAFNGAGDTMTPTWVNIFCFLVVQVPLVYTLALYLGFGPQGGASGRCLFRMCSLV